MSEDRPEPRQPATRERLTRAWRQWVAENLLQGTPANVISDALAEALAEEGIAAATARAWVDAIDRSPELAAGRAMTRRMRQLEMRARLERALAETADDPGAVPRRPGLDADAFFDEHYASHRPVVIPHYASQWPAMGWTPESLAERFGSVPVKITADRASDPDYDMHTADHTQVVPLAEFVEMIRAAGPSNDIYMVAQNRVLEDPRMAPLMDDVPFDRRWFTGRWRKCTALWLGPAGTVTPLHHDTCNILFVQLYGRKRVRLVAPSETSLLDGARAMYAPAGVDPEDPAIAGDGTRPGSVRVRTVDLGPGDAIFLPVGWWHHVRALDVSISLACTHFVRSNQFDWYRPGSMH